MPTVVLGDKKSVTFGAKITDGDLCHIYQGTYKDESSAPVRHTGPRTRFDHILEGDDDGVEIPVIIKICADPSNNDLLDREICVLEILTLLGPGTESKFSQYYPTSYGGFDSHGQRGHVISLVSDCFSVADILKAFPNGIDYRDMAWMFKRTLVGLWWAHQRGLLHGAILPPHILLLGQNHGAKIIDWCSSAVTRSRSLGESDPTVTYSGMTQIHVLLTDYADYYPPEVPEKMEASEATDIYMAAKCMVALLGGDVKTNEMPDSVPIEIRNLLNLCLNPQRRMRPSKADDVHEAFDNLLKSIVGKPAFRTLTLPLPER